MPYCYLRCYSNVLLAALKYWVGSFKETEWSHLLQQNSRNEWCIQICWKMKLPCNRGMQIPSFLPSSHPCGLPGFFSVFSFLSWRWSPAATMLHVNSGTPSRCLSHVLLLPGHWWSGKTKMHLQVGLFTQTIPKKWIIKSFILQLQNNTQT